jgi:hypothetical protein
MVLILYKLIPVYKLKIFLKEPLPEAHGWGTLLSQKPQKLGNTFDPASGEYF